MKVFGIWIALICCGVANGIFYHISDGIGWIFKLSLIFPCMIAIMLLYIHRKVTKDWKRYPDPWSGYRFPIFSLTLFLSVCALILLWLASKNNPPVTAGLITIAIASFIAFWREKDYVEEV